RAQANKLLPQRETVRLKLGLQGVVILFVGRMVDSFKRVSVLLRATAQVQQQARIQLMLIGEGPDRAEYERTVTTLGIQARFQNFTDKAGLAEYYAAADIFVLPSRSETWGLVINEAMEFGLPIVTTSAVGAAPDLVTDGENGYVVPPDDAGALAAALT